MKNKLNVGCGLDYRKGWINLDMHKNNKADIVFNLADIPKNKLPFKDNSIDYIYCSHVLEDFIDFMPIINEFVRICKQNGIIEIKVPFETSVHLVNPHHKASFTLCKLNSIAEDYFYTDYGNKNKLEVLELNYYADNGKGKISQLLKKVIARSYNLLPYKLVERTFLKYLFSVLNLRVIYRKRGNA